MRTNGTLLRIRGKVQGVGFRPWVWQLARLLGLKGDVCNDGAGVVVRLVGETQAFMLQLAAGGPPLRASTTSASSRGTGRRYRRHSPFCPAGRGR